MQIKEIFDKKKLTLSFEVFPPKQQGNLDILPQKIQTLAALKPDFISVTCGAGGSTKDQTLEVSKMVADSGTASLTHLTCVS
ncbi:MAG: methylenetetrahydrofolate reductase, partial [Treponema sp.]|nr:methylenetetrahydrofolate reductase [Treponema sp.]